MSLISKGVTSAPSPNAQQLAPKPLLVDNANATPASALNAVRDQENRQNMANNMHGGWIPMGSNAYDIDQVNAVVNRDNHNNVSAARRRMRRRDRRNVRNPHNQGPPPPRGHTHRGTVKGFGFGGGNGRTARRNRSRFTRSRRNRKPLSAFQRRVSHRVRMNLLHRKIRKSKNNYTQRRNQMQRQQQQQQGGEAVVPQHGTSCAGGAAQQNCPGNTSAALLDANRQAMANAQGDSV